MRYIDADKLQKDGWKLRREKHGLVTSTYETMELDCVPTADVVPMDFHDRCMEIEIQKRMNMVEVVRCKDCKHFDEDIQGTGLCSLRGQLEWAYMNTMYADDFCSYGEREDNG